MKSIDIWTIADSRVSKGKIGTVMNFLFGGRFVKLFQRDNPTFARTHVSELPTPFYLMFIDKPKLAEMITQLDQLLATARRGEWTPPTLAKT